MAAFFQGLIVTLREGIEAALLVALMLAALDRSGRRGLRSSVYAGLLVAAAASISGAALFQRVKVSEEAFEGVLYLAAAVMVGSMLVWMQRHARGMRGTIEGRIDRLGGGAGSLAAWLGLFLFSFLTVFREGVETVAFLGILNFTSAGVGTLVGGLTGIGLAALFAVFFIRGSLRIDLARFFRVTTIVLFVFVAQLLINGIHELSEARWLPGGPTEMAIVGPIVAHNTLFLAAILLIPVILLLVPSSRRPAPEPVPETSAERRKALAAARRSQRGRIFAAAAGMVIVLVLGVDSLVLSRPRPPEPADNATLQGQFVLVPLNRLATGKLGCYAATAARKQVRFLLLKQKSGAISSALDACEMCGDKGYRQEGDSLICINCAAEINAPTLGQGGGCNPIPLKSHVDGQNVVIALSDLEAGARYFHGTAAR